MSVYLCWYKPSSKLVFCIKAFISNLIKLDKVSNLRFSFKLQLLNWSSRVWQDLFSSFKLKAGRYTQRFSLNESLKCKWDVLGSSPTKMAFSCAVKSFIILLFQSSSVFLAFLHFKRILFTYFPLAESVDLASCDLDGANIYPNPHWFQNNRISVVQKWSRKARKWQGTGDLETVWGCCQLFVFTQMRSRTSCHPGSKTTAVHSSPNAQTSATSSPNNAQPPSPSLSHP